jgi:hypothetical protein
MRFAARQLILLLLLAFLLPAISSHASPTPPPLPDLEHLADQSVAESADILDPIDWAALEADPTAVLAVLIIPADPFEEEEIRDRLILRKDKEGN